jgi:hypothetical protein
MLALLTWPDAAAVSVVGVALAVLLAVLAWQIFATGREDMRR